MSEESLDLERDALENIPGKLIHLSGATYQLGRLVSEQQGQVVFPMLNVRSGISLFRTRVQKCDNSADLLTDLRVRFFCLDPPGSPPAYTEVHRVPGGIVYFENNPEVVLDSDYHAGLVRAGMAYVAAGQWAEAAKTYATVLERNPNHTRVMLALAACPHGPHEVPKVVRLLEQALEVEPNDTQIYHSMAKLFLAMDCPEAALEIVDKAFDRYLWDFKTWQLKISIAERFGLSSTLEQMRAELVSREVGPKCSPLVECKAAELDKPLDRAVSVRTLIESAIERQTRRDWPGALAQWELVGTRHLDAFNQLNLNICKYWLGQWGEASDRALSLAWSLGAYPLAHRAASIVALVGGQRAGKSDSALGLMRYLARLNDSPMDVPCLPIVVFSDDHRLSEEVSSEAILLALRALGETSHDSADLAASEKLCELYRQREAKLQNHDREDSPTHPWWKIW